MSIGELEPLAGIGPSEAERAAFWKPYAKLPGALGLKMGCDEMRRLARVKEAEKERPRSRKAF